MSALPVIALRDQTDNQIRFNLTPPTHADYSKTIIRYGVIKETDMTLVDSSEEVANIITISDLTPGSFYIFTPIALNSSDLPISTGAVGNSVIASINPNIVKMSTLEADSDALTQLKIELNRRVTVSVLDDVILKDIKSYIDRMDLVIDKLKKQQRSLAVQINAIQRRL